MDVLGVYCFGQHDSSAALLRDGRVFAACEEERFTRRKFDNCFPAESIAFCLGQNSIEVRDLDAVAFGWNPRLHRLDKALHILKHFPRSLRVLTRSGPRHLRLNSFTRHFSNRTNFRGPIHLVNHHLAHAASAFFLSPFEEAAILTIDGVGEWETVWMGRGRGVRLEKTRSQGWPHSLGNVYTSVTQYLGFQMYSDEYKVMGLAPYGRPAYLDLFRKMVPLTDGGFGVDTSYFGYHVGEDPTYSKKFIRELGPPREPEGEILPRHQDIAASLQARTEEILVHLAREALQHTKTKYLCMAGGVALNSVAVGKVIELGLAEEVYVPPCAGDAGVSLGAALYVAHHLSGRERQEPLLDARLGPEWSDEIIRETLKGTGLLYQEWSEGETAATLAAGQVVGWFQGRMEFGQRALGARSILADPRRPEMKDLINAKVKFREAFRPFAPSVPEERLGEFFHGTQPSPFMTQVYRVREESRPLLPAVTHVDGTARVQTVRRDFDPKFWSLLQAFEAQAGIPVLLNTSFNLRGEPIVNTPEEAVKSFLRANLDLLVMGRWAARKDPETPL